MTLASFHTLSHFCAQKCAILGHFWLIFTCRKGVGSFLGISRRSIWGENRVKNGPKIAHSFAGVPVNFGCQLGALILALKRKEWKYPLSLLRAKPKSCSWHSQEGAQPTEPDFLALFEISQKRSKKSASKAGILLFA